VLAAAERYLEIEDLVGVANGRWSGPGGIPTSVRTAEEAEAAAMRLRAAWRLGNDALPNIAEFLEGRGVKIVSLILPGSMSGLGCLARRRRWITSAKRLCAHTCAISQTISSKAGEPARAGRSWRPGTSPRNLRPLVWSLRA